jgi:hypothetical protein
MICSLQRRPNNMVSLIWSHKQITIILKTAHEERLDILLVHYRYLCDLEDPKLILKEFQFLP